MNLLVGNGSVKLIISDDYNSMTTKLWLQEIQGSEMYLIGFDGQLLVKQKITPENEYDAVTSFKPFLQFNLFMKPVIMKAFLDAASNINIKTVDENLLEGKMEAMKDHLTDSKGILDKVLSMLDKSIK